MAPAAELVAALRDVQATGEKFDFYNAEVLESRFVGLCQTRAAEAVSAGNSDESFKWAATWSAIKQFGAWARADPHILEAGKKNGLQGIIDHLTPPPPVEYSSTVLVELENSWKADYQDPHDVLGYVCETLDGYVHEWKPGLTYLTAWTSVIQSSGWGKSKTICELWRKGVYVIYLSFMPSERMGIPPGTPAAQAVSVNLEKVPERAFASWFLAFLEILVDFIVTGDRNASAEDPVVAKAADWMKYQVDNAAKIKDKATSRQGILSAEIHGQKSGEGAVRGKEWVDSPLRKWFQEKISGLLSREGLEQMLRARSKLRILFCLDEAGSLFKSHPSSFLAFRRVFSIVNLGSGIFGLVMDTTARLGLQSPQSDPSGPRGSRDPSAKGTREDTMVFAPLSLVGVSWLDTSRLRRLREKSVERPSLEATVELFRLGRPLWRSCLPGKRAPDLGYFEEVRTFACQKLLGGATLNQIHKDPSCMTEAMAMAIVGVAAGLEVAPWSNLAVEMVAGHMRTAVEISDERDRVFSADAMEPILGEAAAIILGDRGTLVRILQLVQIVCKQALVVEGPRGELVGRLLLVMAMHSCYKEKPLDLSYNVYAYPVKLGHFLTKLCGVKVKAEGLVCFNRFIVLNRQVTRDDLFLCFLCGCAIQPPRNQEAFDNLVPYLAPGPDGTYQLLKERMMAIPVQIRNRDTYATNTERLAKFAEFFYTHSEDGFDATVVCEYMPDLQNEADRALGILSPGRQKRRFVEEPERLMDFANDDDAHYHKAPQDGEPIVDHAQMEFEQPVIAEHEVKGALGLYLHLRGRRSTFPYFQSARGGKVFVLHGMRPYTFLDHEICRLLEELRLAFHKLPETGKHADILRHVIPTYFRPKFRVVTEAQLTILTIKQLEDLCTKRNIKVVAGWKKADYVKALMELVLCCKCNMARVEDGLGTDWIVCDCCKKCCHYKCVGVREHVSGMPWLCDRCSRMDADGDMAEPEGYTRSKKLKRKNK